MNNFENYFWIFIDTLYSNLAININGELALESAIIFNNYNNIAIFILALLGYFISINLDYFFGKMLYKLVGDNDSNRDLANKVKKNHIKYTLILLSVIPNYGKFIILILSFYNINYRNLIPLAFLLKAIYYLYNIFF